MPEVSDDQDRMMRQFLLDKLDLEERERFEERFLTEKAFKEDLLMAEDILIEDYLDNALDDADRELFQSLFSSSPEQRDKLTMARAIRAYAKSEVARVSPSTENVSEDLLKLEDRRGPNQPAKNNRRLALLIAATVVMVILATLWLTLRSQRVNESAADKSKQAILTELAELNSDSRASETTPGETQSVLLAPINTRGSGPPRISRQAGVSVIEFWLLPASLENASFKAVIKQDGVSGQYEVSNLPLVDKQQGRAVRLKIPAHLLNSGTYQVDLTAVGPKGDSAYAGEYRFQVAN